MLPKASLCAFMALLPKIFVLWVALLAPSLCSESLTAKYIKGLFQVVIICVFKKKAISLPQTS